MRCLILAATRSLCLAFAFILFFINGFSQADMASNVSSWKSQFPKEDVIVYSYKESVTFSLNEHPVTGEGSVKAKVVNELNVVPVKDFIKYEDGLFYNDEVSIDNVKV